MGARFCQRCGAALTPNSAFCSGCGTPVPGGTPTHCSRCGAPLVPKSTFCANCGTPVGAVSAAPYAAMPPLAYGSPMPPYGMTAVPPFWASPAPRATDLKALSYVQAAALLGVIAFAVSIASFLVVPFASIAGQVSSTSSNSVAVSGIALLVILLTVGLVFGLVELYLYRSAFAELEPYDPRFSTPKRLALLAMIGLLLIVVSTAGLFDVLYQANACANGNPISTNGCLDLGTLLGLVILVIAAAIIVLIGTIGVAIGVWRLGTRYDEGLFKAGAILFILIGFIGAILILVAAHSVRSRIGPEVPLAPFR